MFPLHFGFLARMYILLWEGEPLFSLIAPMAYPQLSAALDLESHFLESPNVDFSGSVGNSSLPRRPFALIDRNTVTIKLLQQLLGLPPRCYFLCASYFKSAQNCDSLRI